MPSDYHEPPEPSQGITDSQCARPSPRDDRKEKERSRYSNAFEYGPTRYVVPHDLRQNPMGSTQNSRGGYHDRRRQSSPVTSFLSQIPLENRPDSRIRTAGARDNQDVHHQARHRPAHDEINGRQHHNELSDSASRPNATLKRSAPRSEQYTERDEATKRQRQHSGERGFFEPSAARPKAATTSRTLVESNDGRTDQDTRKPQLLENTRRGNREGLTKPTLAAVHLNQTPPFKAAAYVDASTQTEDTSISSSKLALLQEEEAIAQRKHKAEMARRREAMALEFEHERQMLELRHQFEVRSAKGGRSTAASVDRLDSPRLAAPTQQDQTINEGKATLIAPNSVKQASPQKDPSHASTELKVLGASRKSPTVPPDLTQGTESKAESLGKQGQEPIGKQADERTTIPEDSTSRWSNISGAVEGRSKRGNGGNDADNEEHSKPGVDAVLRPMPTLPSSDVDRSSAVRHSLKKPASHGLHSYNTRAVPQTSAEASDRPKSSSTASVHIKTSPSPRHVHHDRPSVEASRWPSVKHITCYFWKTARCYKSASECSYAHHDTGNIAMNPESMRKRKRDDTYRPHGGW